ncbi:MAG: folylpolyglutamate synthase/dihydrofolate synthase family protein [Thermodesulfobacteriota bacterium]
MTASPARNLDQEYEETYAFLCSLERFGILLGLENITRLLEGLGNPQKRFPSIHVAGTKGKGSTASFVYHILEDAGFTAALYTSPHLNDFRERIRVNGSLVSKEAIIAATERIRQVYDPEHTTFFEFTTAVAFECIAQAKPDIAVVEVGLGGRLDATNTVAPLVAVITDIAREHEDYLGQGIESIAREKAGIIKRGVPLVTGATRKGARKVIGEVAEEFGARMKLFGRDFIGKRTGPSLFTYRSERQELEGLRLSMVGAHQVKNAALACAVVEELQDQGYAIPEAAIRSGLARTKFAGRFEVLSRSPDVVIDGAHSPESMRLLKSTLRQTYPGVRPFLVLGMLREKNYREMVRIIAPIAKEVVCVAPQGDRALDPEELAALVRELGIPVFVARSIEEGFRKALGKAGKNDVVLATGSLYMIGPIRRACGRSDE